MKTFLITLTGISGFLRLLLLPPPDIGGALIGNPPLPRSITKVQLSQFSRVGLPPKESLSLSARSFTEKGRARFNRGSVIIPAGTSR